MVKNAYIHIPFCSGGKCNYCSFVSYPDLSLKSEYLAALKKQIQAELHLKIPQSVDGGLVNPPYFFDATPTEKLNTLYFGGGTPSLLTIDEIKSIMELFKFEDEAEITVEVNPESVNLEYFIGLKRLGVNRISIGLQTFDDKILKLIGRRHSSAQFRTALNCALKAGFENISVDLIYGLPEQSLEDFEQDLELVSKLNIKHVSLYGLKIDEGCYFYDNQPLNLADGDLQADMYLKAIEILTQNGFEHYEISNFAKRDAIGLPRPSLRSLLAMTVARCIKPLRSLREALLERRRSNPSNNFMSKHNLNYWDANTYYGFGCAASGYISNCPPPQPSPLKGGGGVRYTNESNLEKYIENPLKKEIEQELSEQERLEEAIFLGLRKIAGINIIEINQKFGIDFNQKYAKILEKYSDFFIYRDLQTMPDTNLQSRLGLLTQQQKSDKALTVAFNQKGILLSNEILSEFID